MHVHKHRAQFSAFPSQCLYPMASVCTDLWNGLRMKVTCLNEPHLDTQLNVSAEDTKLIDSFYCGSLMELTSGLTTPPRVQNLQESSLQ